MDHNNLKGMILVEKLKQLQCNLKTWSSPRPAVNSSYCGCFVKTLLDTVCAIQNMVKTTLAALAEELVGLRHPRGSLTPSSECCPQFQPAAKYTQLLQGPLEGARARYEPPARLTQRDGEVLARKPAKELQQQRYRGAAYPWTGRRRVVAPDWTLLYNVPSLSIILWDSRARSRATIRIAAAPVLYAWYPQAVVAVPH